MWSALTGSRKPARHALGVVGWCGRGFVHCPSQRLPEARGRSSASPALAAAASTHHVPTAEGCQGGCCGCMGPLDPASCPPLGLAEVRARCGKEREFSHREIWHKAGVEFSHLGPFCSHTRAPSSHWAAETGNKLWSLKVIACGRY